MPKAAIFDVDGTLIDSVDFHALAWHEAMEKFGHDVSFEQARGQIGKGGDKLMAVFLSGEAQRDHGKEMEEWRRERFKSAYLPLVRPFSAVPDLLRRVRDAGLQVAIASSAKKDELGKYLDIARIADLLAGEYNDPRRVIAFNTAERWSEDVSEDSRAAAALRSGDAEQTIFY
jgi:phosphoglycolate phosphatase-like HAD superfamily hydrolase